jgi:large subunit ribosomal protein L22
LNRLWCRCKHNFKLDKQDLYVRHITADGGPTLSRWRPRAFGRAAPIRKRTTHITLILSTKGDAKPAASKESAPAKKAPAKKAAAKTTK